MTKGSSGAGGGRHGPLSGRWARISEEISAQLWPLPTTAIVIAVLLGIYLPVLDTTIDEDLPATLRDFLFAGGVGSARALLSAIAGSLITATSLTFSLTVVALQLASSQASPRLLRLFAKDRTVHATLAVFLGTFAYALTALRTVQDGDETTDAIVPRITITLASLLTLASVIMLTLFLAHLATLLRVDTMLHNVHKETDRTIAVMSETPADAGGRAEAVARPADSHTTRAASSGFITSVNRAKLLAVAVQHDIVIEERNPVGSSVVSGLPLASWWPCSAGGDDSVPAHDDIDKAVNAAYATGYERTAGQDVGYGLRQLVDVANRSLSPAVNDPTTAVNALRHVSALLRSIAALPDEPPALQDADGTLRLITCRYGFADLLELGVQQPRRYGASDPDVAGRLFELLREVAEAAHTAGQRDEVRAQCRRLTASVLDGGYDETELARFERQRLQVEEALSPTPPPPPLPLLPPVPPPL